MTKLEKNIDELKETLSDLRWQYRFYRAELNKAIRNKEKDKIAYFRSQKSEVSEQKKEINEKLNKLYEV